MTSSSNSQQKVSPSQQQQEQQQQQNVPQKNCLIPMDELKVLGEMMVDFENLDERDIHLKDNMIFQGWEAFLYRLCGPIFPELVKEFWVHASLMPKSFLSFVHGEEISITENLLKRLFGLETIEGVSGAIVGRTDWDAVYAEIFKPGKESTSIKELKDPYRIWAKILLGCIYHRKATVSPNYVNKDQQYILYCIGNKEKVDLPFIIFNHMWNHVRDSREQARLKSTKYKRNIIPFGRIITDLLVQTRLVGDLEKAGIVIDPYAICGSTMNAHTLKKMNLIETIAATPSVDHEILTIRAPALADFELFLKNEHPNIVVKYMKLCKEEGSAYDPVWISNKELLTTADQVPEKEEEKKKKKRKQDQQEGRKDKKEKKEE
ncbi:uncharacterized protein LOC131597240 [Vicia villosa]|uniref:uncharacterized protein LOC131597240 n=1 Tax=Vicia villosa TaxID=3911 RepID=UPI00273C96EF|nr:uncharacterized protein LOC131597240 [Vicia villosa]